MLELVPPLELEVELLVPPELELLELLVPPLWPQPGGGLVDEPGVGGGQALLVEVFPATTWGAAPGLLAPANAAPIGTVSPTARAAPNRTLSRVIYPPQPSFLPNYRV